jgi:hypothetical protein
MVINSHHFDQWFWWTDKDVRNVINQKRLWEGLQDLFSKSGLYPAEIQVQLYGILLGEIERPLTTADMHEFFLYSKVKGEFGTKHVALFGHKQHYAGKTKHERTIISMMIEDTLLITRVNNLEKEIAKLMLITPQKKLAELSYINKDFREYRQLIHLSNMDKPFTWQREGERKLGFLDLYFLVTGELEIVSHLAKESFDPFAKNIKLFPYLSEEALILIVFLVSLYAYEDTFFIWIAVWIGFPLVQGTSIYWFGGASFKSYLSDLYAFKNVILLKFFFVPELHTRLSDKNIFMLDLDSPHKPLPLKELAEKLQGILNQLIPKTSVNMYVKTP